MSAYYNEIDAYAAQWLRNLVAKGLIANGEIDTRSIVDVRADDLRAYRQCHFFAGLGGWSYALKLAGWPDERPVWTGSCPCQPLSVAGQGKGDLDERHLWPAFHHLIAERRPAVVFGEQVASALGREWFAGVRADLEATGYACGGAVIPACGVGAPHRRERLWFVADADEPRAGERREQRSGQLGGTGRNPQDRAGPLADAGGGRRDRPEEGQGQLAGRAEAVGAGRGDVGDADSAGLALRETIRRGPGGPHGGHSGDDVAPPSPWATAGWVVGADGRARRVEPSLRLLAHGVPARVGRLRAYGNAIVPQVAAAFIESFMKCRP